MSVVTIQSAPLDQLAELINIEQDAVEAATASAVEHAEAAGRYLLEAKEQVPFGQWERWVQANTRLSPRTARAYTQMARLDPADRQRVADLSLREALREIAAHRPIETKFEERTIGGRPIETKFEDGTISGKTLEVEIDDIEVPNRPEQDAPRKDKPPLVTLTAEEFSEVETAHESSPHLGDMTLLNALRLIDKTDAATLARVANQDDSVNLQELAGLFAEAASLALRS